MNEGFNLLQFGKYNDASFCTCQIEELPPPVPAPVLSSNKEPYMDFNSLSGKVLTTEKDCPSLQKKTKRTKGRINLATSLLRVTVQHATMCV